MRAKEVVVSYKESSKSNSAIDTIEAVRRLHVIFIGSVEAFNELFKRSEFLGLFIKVLKSNNLMVFNRSVTV